MVGAKQIENFGAHLRIVTTRVVDEPHALIGRKVDDGIEDRIDAAESIGRWRVHMSSLTSCSGRAQGHAEGSAAISRWSQLFARAQSRFAVRRPIPSASAVSSSVMPPKKRHSTTCA